MSFATGHAGAAFGAGFTTAFSTTFSTALATAFATALAILPDSTPELDIVVAGLATGFGNGFVAGLAGLDVLLACLEGLLALAGFATARDMDGRGSGDASTISKALGLLWALQPKALDIERVRGREETMPHSTTEPSGDSPMAPLSTMQLRELAGLLAAMAAACPSPGRGAMRL